jgi:hypothetical protein
MPTHNTVTFLPDAEIQHSDVSYLSRNDNTFNIYRFICQVLEVGNQSDYYYSKKNLKILTYKNILYSRMRQNGTKWVCDRKHHTP